MDIRAGGRKTNFEIVPKPDLPPERAPLRIISVSYDESLAETREMIFASAGFEVSTFTNLFRAVRACRAEDFDLIVIGHSIPAHERKKLVAEVRSVCSAPILALSRHGESPLAGADHTFDASQSPAQLLELVIDILEKPRRELP